MLLEDRFHRRAGPARRFLVKGEIHASAFIARPEGRTLALAVRHGGYTEVWALELR